MGKLLVIDMNVAKAQARHSGYFGAWNGAMNPHKVGGQLWAEWTLGRRSAATGKPESQLIAEAKASWQPMLVTDWE
jgi:hypothetical protein